jgi:pilus assembly protein CpaE
MFVQLHAVIVDPDETNRQELANFLTSFGVGISNQLATPDTLQTLLARSDAPQLCVVNLDPGAQDNLKKIAHLPRQFPGVSFFVMSQVLDPNLLMEAMHIGVREFIPLPIVEQKFTAAIERVATQHGMGKNARIINVISTQGGCGSTTIACNIAAAMAGSARTVLVDMDLVRGGVASYFNVRPRFTIGDIMESAEKLDKQMLDNVLTMHRGSNVSLLARPELPEDSLRVRQQGVQRLLNVLGRIFEVVVVDSPMSVDPIHAATIQAADITLVVMQLNVPSAKNAERYVGCLRRMGVESTKIKILVNRYVKRGMDIEPAEVEKALGLQISWVIPNDFKNAIAAINYGEPVVLRAPRSEMSTALIDLAAALNPKVSQKNAA